MPLNPYEALPGSPTPTGGTEGLTRDGKYVITAVTATWPARCVKCNRGVPAAAYHAKLTWTPRWVIFVFLLSRLIGLILFFVKRRTVNLHVGLCEEHTERRRMHLFIWGGTLGMSVLMGVGGAAMDSGAALAVAGLAFFTGLIGLALTAAVLRVHKVQGEQAWVLAGEPFLHSL